jgi:hypothetical protein
MPFFLTLFLGNIFPNWSSGVSSYEAFSRDLLLEEASDEAVYQAFFFSTNALTSPADAFLTHTNSNYDGCHHIIWPHTTYIR